MGKVQKINFPYLLPHTFNTISDKDRVVIFFGADFYNLPIGSNQGLFIEETNKILNFIRKNFPNRKLLYQAHPNETDEYKSLDLTGFTMGQRAVAEILLYDNASNIEYVFSVLSGASISAYAMGFNSAIFIDRLHGIIPNEAIVGYRSYFSGLPVHFFISSLEDSPFMRNDIEENDYKNLLTFKDSVNDSKTIWFLSNDPSTFVKAMILAKVFKENIKELKTGLIKIKSKRWTSIESREDFFDVFDDIVVPKLENVRYSARPKKIFKAIQSALSIKKLPIKSPDTMISFATMLFEENCILSYFPWKNKIALIENRWYDFTYEDGYKTLNEKDMKLSWGVKMFNYILEPILKINRTVYKEYKDGKVINFFRYRKPLEKIYNSIFVLMPALIEGNGIISTQNYKNEKFKKKMNPILSLRKIIGNTIRSYKRYETAFEINKHRKGDSKNVKLSSKKTLSALLASPVLLHDSEVVALQRLAEESDGVIVEIGAAFGGSSLAMLLNKSESSTLFSIDPFVVDSMATFQATEVNCKKNVTKALKLVGLSGRVKDWTVIPKYSFDAVKDWKQEISMIFIDGDHRFEAVKQDFEDWLPFVKKDGLILFHDSCRTPNTPADKYDKGWQGPTEFVEELLQDKRVKLVEKIHSLSVFKKS